MITMYKEQLDTLKFVQVSMTIKLKSDSVVNALTLKVNTLNKEMQFWYSREAPTTKLWYEDGQQKVKAMIKYASSFEDEALIWRIKSMVNALMNI